MSYWYTFIHAIIHTRKWVIHIWICSYKEVTCLCKDMSYSYTRKWVIHIQGNDLFIQGNELFIYGIIHTRKWVIHISISYYICLYALCMYICMIKITSYTYHSVIWTIESLKKAHQKWIWKYSYSYKGLFDRVYFSWKEDKLYSNSQTSRKVGNLWWQ